MGIQEILWPALGAVVTLLASGYAKKLLDVGKDRDDAERSLRDELRLELARLRDAYAALSSRLDGVELELRARDKEIEAGRGVYWDLIHAYNQLLLTFERVKALARAAYLQIGGDMPDDLEVSIAPATPSPVFDRRGKVEA
jgi:hypothetical protein